jgi:hypothetical protein
MGFSVVLAACALWLAGMGGLFRCCAVPEQGYHFGGMLDVYLNIYITNMYGSMNIKCRRILTQQTENRQCIKLLNVLKVHDACSTQHKYLYFYAHSCISCSHSRILI